MLSLMGPNDLQLWIDGNYECGKDWSRGFITDAHTFENPLELWKYYWNDTDGVAGSDRLNAGGVVQIPGRLDTSLQNRKQMPDSMPWTASHHSLMVERRSAHDLVVANDLILSVPNLLMAEARLWYEIYFDSDLEPADRGLVTEFPPGFGPEVDSTQEATSVIRTGMNNYSVVKMLPRTRFVTKQLLAKIFPMHSGTNFAASGGVTASDGVGLRNTVYWFKK